MDFAFTDEQIAFRNEVRAFCEKEVTKEIMDEIYVKGDEHSPSFYKKLAEKGWIGLDFPVEYGGLGKKQIEMAIFREETAYYMAPMMSNEINNILTHSILLIGDENQKKEFVPSVAKGNILFCMGYTEPGSGSDLASLKTRAVKDGDKYLVNGQKIFTTNAHIADYCVLAARTDPQAPKHKGISLFIIDMKTKGIEIGPLWTLGGYRVNTVYFENVIIDESTRIGRENEGWKALALALDIERSGLVYVGKARRILDETIKYLNREKPECLEPNHWVSEKLNGLLAEVKAARLLTYRVPLMQAEGKVPNGEASMAKLYTTELLKKVSTTAIEVMGKDALLTHKSMRNLVNGLFEENYRSSAMGTIVAGTSQIQREIIAKRGLHLASK
ncbi:acyl-CoA dehydrogenase family protein [Neobacillus rhizophilus]|uniref:Acyl-CoA dehydrogenase family protein n=1 Tax=Neobacillus rhizophilus TaxID=2833579 RepID=A0A942YWC9_9BACI|nr:acyl-CoA dehydrogenase family protein [Neobacillus rhizophilus]MBS4214964.1 acyl-CoA dehydrogenase family protein [Neobacillus rhizophilus]